MTVNELVSYLCHSSLPTVLVEGRDDLSIFRWVEPLIGAGVTILPCGGKDSLLQVYERREAFLGKPVAFLVDQDMWLFEGVPEGLEELVTTEGYSIENDLLTDGVAERLLDVEEKEGYLKDLEVVVSWFSSQVETYMQGHQYCVDLHVRRVLAMPVGSVDKSAVYFDLIMDDYLKQLRGKTLLELLVYYLSSTKRKSKFTKINVLEISTKTGSNLSFLEEVRRRLAA